MFREMAYSAKYKHAPKVDRALQAFAGYKTGRMDGKIQKRMNSVSLHSYNYTRCWLPVPLPELSLTASMVQRPTGHERELVVVSCRNPGASHLSSSSAAPSYSFHNVAAHTTVSLLHLLLGLVVFFRLAGLLLGVHLDNLRQIRLAGSNLLAGNGGRTLLHVAQ